MKTHRGVKSRKTHISPVFNTGVWIIDNKAQCKQKEILILITGGYCIITMFVDCSFLLKYFREIFSE